jgi:cysteinyl-tRNA synthetase
VKSWAYQLQKANMAEIAASPFDLVVIDYSRDGSEVGRWTKGQLQRMQRKPDGKRRIVLAYLSIGEAEDYRFYWNKNWVEALDVVAGPQPFGPPPAAHTADGRAPSAPVAPAAPVPLRKVHVPTLTAPIWLGRENDQWSSNYLVRFWDKGWQELLFGSPRAYLERILAAGFDGVYLDRVDAYYAVKWNRPSASAEMIDLVARLARHARGTNPDFVVVPQNAEELLQVKEYLEVVDGIAKEDMFYGSPGPGLHNDPAQVANSLGWLSPADRAGLPVFVVEYLEDPVTVYAARAEIEARGFIPYFSQRALEKLVLPLPPAPPGLAGVTPSSGTTGGPAPKPAPARP